MSDWREETSLDLKDARLRIEAAIGSISGDPTEAQVRSIWLAYVWLEKSIVFIRLEIHEENPGRFISAKAYRVPDERQALQFALRNLVKGSQSFEAGAFGQALKELREARNYLRVLVKELWARRNRARRQPG